MEAAHLSIDMRLSLSRRAIATALAPLLTIQVARSPASAFPNALAEAAAQPKIKSPGPRPSEIGLKPNGELRPCLDGKPHCFSSSTLVGEYQANTNKIGRDWIVQPWSYKGMTVAGATLDLKQAIQAYPPGQAGIDSGGWQIITERFPESPDDAGYIYAQFELTSGYIDDFEFAIMNGKVNVRSSSRLGFLDFGVNAKRYNYFAKKLASKKGWTTAPIRAKEHLEYFGQNDVTDQEVGL